MKAQGPATPSPEGQEKMPLIEYPTLYTFKVIGLQGPDFAEYVRSLFQRLMGTELSPDALREQPSSKGKYVSVSVSVYLLSEEHRRTLYAQLHQEKRLLYYL